MTLSREQVIEMNPCPYSFVEKDAGHNLDIDYEAILPRVACSCGARGPVMSGKDDAIQAWNARPSPDAGGVVMGRCLGCAGGSIHHTCGKLPDALPVQSADVVERYERETFDKWWISRVAKRWENDE